MKQIDCSFHIKNVCGLLLLVLLAATSCKKKNEMELYKGDAPLNLSADKATLVLQQQNDAADAVLFTWTSGSNKGTNASIDYTLMIDKQGNHFSSAVKEDLGKAALSRKYTVKDLNDLLLSHWSLQPGTEATLEAKIVAVVSDATVPADTSNTIVVKITSYKPVTAALYMIGDAAPNGWSADNATALQAVSGTPGGFSWQGQLKSGELKFITSLGQFLPSYNKGADDLHLVYRTADGQADNKFVIATPGLYAITLNLLDLSITIKAATTPAYKRLWMLGDAIPTGWDIQAPAEMRVDSSNLFVFTYNEILKAGEFKIPTATGNFNTDYYMPLTNHPALTETGAQLVPGGTPDLKWQITTAGPYKIRLDIQNNNISIKAFTPYTKIWMVGDASPVGWNIDNPQPMTVDPANPYVFTYTGAMSVGEFKFPLATGNWGCDYFMPVLNGSGPGSTQMRFVAAGNPDYKWKITQAGNYKITINQLYETISIVKQ